MKINKYLIIPFVLVVCYFSCNSKPDLKKKVIVEKLSNEKQLKKLYMTTVVPLFNTYKDVKIPVSFKIDTQDKTINAGAASDYVEVSQGLIDYKKEYIQIYVLAHEIAHIVTLNQAERFNLGKIIPAGSITNEYKKSEYLADLIAIHLMNIHLKKQMNLLYNDFAILKNLLGSKSFTHPSSSERIKAMREYINESRNSNSSIIFKKLFEKIWNME